MFDWVTPDLINAVFEVSGGFFIMLSVIKTYKDKDVRGVSWIAVMFFTVWGFWNLYYYPSLEQWMSLIGSVFLVFMNTIWIAQLLYYTYRKKH